MSKFEHEFSLMKEQCQKNGMLEYHLQLLESPLLTDASKLEVVKVWEQLGGKHASRIVSTNPASGQWGR